MTLTTLLINDIRDVSKARIGTTFTHGAVGSDNTASQASDTTLGSEDFRSAIDDFDDSATSTTTTQLQVGLTENNGNNIKETGWFNAGAAGTMWTRNVITTIAKTADIRVFLDTQITFTISETT